MNIRYVPTSEDFDYFTFEASQRLVDILRGDVDIDAVLYGLGEHHEDDA